LRRRFPSRATLIAKIAEEAVAAASILRLQKPERVDGVWRV
jgi:hypothetical protein